MSKNGKNIVNKMFVNQRLEFATLQDLGLKNCHKDVSKAWSNPSAHGCTSYLEVILTIKLKVVELQHKVEKLNQ